MDEIRVTYSGLISLILGVFNILIGLGFTIIITRTLSEIEFGTWGLIGGLVIYATIIEPIVTFWTTREIARNQESANTAIFTGLFLSGIGLVIYLVSGIILFYQTEIEQDVIYVGLMLVPLFLINKILSSITLGWKPQGVSYGQLVLTSSQLCVGFLLMVIFDFGLIGVIITVAISTIASIGFFIIYNKSKLKTSIQKKFIKKWIKFSWVSLYPNLGPTIIAFDVMVFSIITGSIFGIAFWTASLTIVSVLSAPQLISRATYSKLLQGGDKTFVQENMRLLIYFIILFTGIVITFAKHGLFILNPIYSEIGLIVIIMAMWVAIRVISSNLLTFVTGVDQVDVDEHQNTRNYFKSSLIHVPSIYLIQSIVYIVTLSIVLLFTTFSNHTNFELILYWAIIQFVIQIPVTIYSIILSQRKINLKYDVVSITKYLLAGTITFGIIFALNAEIIEFETELIKFLPQVLVFVSISAVLYIGITYAIDNKTRNLVKIIFETIKK
jgi:hypothetical protein